MTAWHNDPISPERAKALLTLPLEDKVLTSKGLGYARVLDFIGVAYE